jgi:hypothetical protein
VVALTVVSVIMTAGTALLMSSAKTAKRVQDETLAQQELIRLFRFADEDMRNILIDPVAKNVKTNALLCSGPTRGTTATDLKAKQQGSPCVECYTSGSEKVCELQLNRINRSVTPQVIETLTYIYSQTNQSGDTYTVKFNKKVNKATDSGADVESSLTQRLFAYADADLNGDGTITIAEKTARDVCIEQADASGKKSSALNSTDCWMKDVFPAFNVSTNQKLIQISARTKFGKPGVTKILRADEAEE